MLFARRFNHFLALCGLLLSLVAPSSASAAVPRNQRLAQTIDLDLEQKNALGEVMRQVIGFKDAPWSSDGRVGKSAYAAARRPAQVPYYMRRMYEQYQDGRLFHDADKVRSINSKLDIINNTNFIVFNLSSIDLSAESLVAGQFHVYRKYFEPFVRKTRSRAPSDNKQMHTVTSDEHHMTSPTSNAPDVSDAKAEMRLDVYDMSAQFVRLVASLALSKSTRSGWHSVDVTSFMREILVERIGPSLHEPRLVAVRFESQVGSPIDDCRSTADTRSDCHPRLSRLALLIFTKKQRKLDPHEARDNHHHYTHHRLLFEDVPDVSTSGSTNVESGVQRLPRRGNNEEHEETSEHRRLAWFERRYVNGDVEDRLTQGSDRVSTDDLNTDPDEESMPRETLSTVGLNKRQNTTASRSAIVEDMGFVVSSGNGDRETSGEHSRTGNSAETLFQTRFDSSRWTVARLRTKRSVHENSVEFNDNSKSPATLGQEDSNEIIANPYLPPRATSRRVMHSSVSRQRSQRQHLLKSTTATWSSANAPLTPSATINYTTPADTTKDSTVSSPPKVANGRRRQRPRHPKKRPPAGVVDADGDEDYQSLLLPDPSEYADVGGTTLWNDEIDDGLCKRHRLMVDFADIGWTDSIISPMSFEAFYCDGECRFPIPKKLHPTNHASIQSIVRAVGIHTSVPSACCVPSALKSLNLLYFDENRDIVLGNFPDMSVISCACR